MKDWRTLAAEDGPVGRYLLTLDRRRKERMNCDLVQLLLEGGEVMSLRSEQKEAMADAAFKRNSPDTAAAIRDERWGAGFPCDSHMLALAQAALSVCDEYEEVEVAVEGSGEWLYLPASPSFDYLSARSTYHKEVILRRKQEPAPDVKELARRAVKAWREPQSGLGATMTALAEAVDE